MLMNVVYTIPDQGLSCAGPIGMMASVKAEIAEATGIAYAR